MNYLNFHMSPSFWNVKSEESYWEDLENEPNSVQETICLSKLD